jgi:hypothetical protein
VRIGDEAFERCLQVEGRESEALAVLTETVRTTLTEGAHPVIFFESSAGCHVCDGAISWWDHARGVRAADVVGVVRRLLPVARSLSMQPPGLAARLAENAKNDPVPEVRSRNLDALLRNFPATEEAQTWARSGVFR